MYEITYCDPEGYLCRDTFEGDWFDLQQEIKVMRANGCYDIYAADISNPEPPDDCDYECGFDPYAGCYTDDC